MRFCQADGTPLVDDAPVDPYKTMVAQPADIAKAMGSSSDDVLDLPEQADPARTMYASEAEIRAEMDAKDAGDVIDIPPMGEEEPEFSEPAPPPSPFSTPDLGSPSGAPIPSPFDEPKSYEDAPATPSFAEPKPASEEASYNPFNDPAPMAQAEWTPPPVAQDPSWSNQPVGGNPPPTTAGQNQTLAIISLVTGILSIFCCGWIVPGVVAVVLGFMAKSKAENDPANYGGRTLALWGIITGGVSLVLGIIVVILYLSGFLLSALGNM